MSFPDPGHQRLVDRDLRLRVIQLLYGDRGYSHNVHVLRGALAGLGHDLRADEMANLAEWLAEAGLVDVVSEEPPQTLRLSERGIALAERRIVVRGVALPRP